MKSSSFTEKIKIFLLVPFFIAQTALLPTVATVQEIQGTLKIIRSQQMLKTRAGDPVFPGDRLETGKNDKVFLRFEADGTLVKLAGNTKLQVSKEGEAQAFLSEGLMWGSKTTGNSSFAVRTPVMITAAHGAEFFIKSIGPEQSVVLVKGGVVEVKFEGGISGIGPMKIGFFQKGIGSRVSPIDEKILQDWAAPFEGEDT